MGGSTTGGGGDRAGPSPGRLGAMTNHRPPVRHPRPHLPHRPLWICRRCAQPWPCGQARLDLLHELAADPIYLRIYLASQMHEALRDLHALTPYEMPTPAEVWNRFLAWAAPVIDR